MWLNRILIKFQNRVAIFIIIILYHAVIGLGAGITVYGLLLLTGQPMNEAQRNVALYGFCIFFSISGVASAITYLKAQSGQVKSEEKYLFLIIGSLTACLVPAFVLFTLFTGHSIDKAGWINIGLLTAIMTPMGSGLVVYARRQ